MSFVDTVIAKFAKFKFGNLAKFGIPQPEEGPFSFKISKGTTPVIDVGTIHKIKLGEIKVSYYFVFFFNSILRNII